MQEQVELYLGTVEEQFETIFAFEAILVDVGPD